MDKIIVISDIEWDTDEIDAKYEEDAAFLPETVTVKEPTLEMIEDVEEDSYADSIGEYLSDEFGFCVKGFTARLENNYCG